MRKTKLVVLSFSTLLLLAACGNNTDTGMDPIEPETEIPEVDPVEETDADDSSDNTAEDVSPAEDETNDTNQSDGTPIDTTNGIQDVEFAVSLDAAVQIFLDTFPEAEGIDLVEFDVDDGRYEYEIDGFNSNMEFELTVDAKTGDIREGKSESDADREVGLDFEKIISPKEAMANALTAIGSGYVKEWQLDTDDGRTIYEIDIEGSDSDVDDVTIDAFTGEVLEIDS